MNKIKFKTAFKKRSWILILVIKLVEKVIFIFSTHLISSNIFYLISSNIYFLNYNFFVIVFVCVCVHASPFNRKVEKMLIETLPSVKNISSNIFHLFFIVS